MQVNPIIQKFSAPSVFQFYSLLAKEKQSLNFGQGFPNFPIPDILL